MSRQPRPYRYTEDPFGMGYAGDDPPPVDASADPEAQAMAESYALAKQRGADAPSVGPADRVDRPGAYFRAFPTTIVLFREDLYPGKATLGRILRANGDTTQIVGNVVFPERTTVVAVSARFHCTRVDPPLDAWNNDFAEVQLSRLNGNDLTDQQAPLSVICGTGEAPLPLPGHGWPFGKSEGIAVNGISQTDTWWLWIAFWVIDQVPLANLGVPS